MSNENFVTHEQAVLLKELGFKEQCLYHYTVDGHLISNDRYVYDDLITIEDLTNSINTQCTASRYYCDAPTLSQAQKWLREKKELWVFSNRVKQPEFEGKFYWSISDKDLNEFTTEAFRLFNSYEDALSAGIDECLKLLENE